MKGTVLRPDYLLVDCYEEGDEEQKDAAAYHFDENGKVIPKEGGQ